jgi:hypothetical protein
MACIQDLVFGTTHSLMKLGSAGKHISHLRENTCHCPLFKCFLLINSGALLIKIISLLIISRLTDFQAWKTPSQPVALSHNLWAKINHMIYLCSRTGYYVLLYTDISTSLGLTCVESTILICMIPHYAPACPMCTAHPKVPIPASAQSTKPTV